ncbi:MAG: AgmX/PglI C-terminal domain-containing protein [Sandaracinaceae bacterium]|nr:AgmX/PglI C-terminal domain-containing protein [Sandaracinaceae bacterium]
MAESTPPPPAGGGNLKYAIIGVVLLGASVAVWFGMRGCGEPAETPVVEGASDAGTTERPTALADDDLLLPDDLPDAGEPESDDAGTRIRYVTRYVGGGGGDWACSGDIDQAAAQRAIQANNLQFRNCYERRLKVNQTLSGRVQLQVRVGRDGAVAGVRTGGTLQDPQVTSCVRAIAQRIRFPRPTGNCAVVAVPFDFTPQR